MESTWNLPIISVQDVNLCLTFKSYYRCFRQWYEAGFTNLHIFCQKLVKGSNFWCWWFQNGQNVVSSFHFHVKRKFLCYFNSTEKFVMILPKKETGNVTSKENTNKFDGHLHPQWGSADTRDFVPKIHKIRKRTDHGQMLFEKKVFLRTTSVASLVVKKILIDDSFCSYIENSV